MKNIRKIVRDIMFESRFKQNDLYNHSETITNVIIDFLDTYFEKYKDRLFDGSHWDFSIPETPTKDITNKTGIGKIKTNVEYIYSHENKISGSFKRVKMLDDGSYEVFLEIIIRTDDNINDHFDIIEYWVAHELHHAFRHIKTLNKDSNANKMNRVKNSTKFYTTDFLEAYPPFKNIYGYVLFFVEPRS